MRPFLVLAIILAFAFSQPARAFEVISVPEDVNAVNLSDIVEIVPGTNGRLQLSTAPDADGIIRRIEVLASEQGTNPSFALFALRNDSDQQIERLLVAPFYRLPASGVFQPDLGNARISAVTPSAGIRPVQLADPEADVYEVTLDPGATVTLIAELTSGELPELYLWQPNAYRDYVNSFTLFRGVVLGVASLAAVFLTIMFVVKGRGVFPATAAFAWAVLAYLLIDFAILGRLFGISAGGLQPLRAAAEAGIATTLAGFLFIYLNLHRWHLRFIHLALGLSALFLALFGFAFFQPAIAATIARLVLALLGLSGFFLILLLALRGYDRAVLLVPTWIIFIAWLFYSWLVISGQVTNDVAQPAVGGGLVLVVMLLGFTAVQHAFAEGQVTIGTLSEVERRALALTGSGDFVFDWNIDRDRVTVSDELTTRLGEKRGALRGAIKRWLDRVHPDDRDRFRTAFDTLVELRRGKVSSDLRVAGHDGNYRTFRMRVKPVLGGDGQVNRIVGTLQDVTEDRAARERLLHDAVHDSLTGLPNRQLLLDRLERSLARARTPGGIKPAVFLIDIDRFMELEERIGHSAADSVLLAISRRISRVMRPLDTVARISGDQFAVILASEQTAGKIAESAEQIRKALKAPFNFGDRDLTITASIGVTIYDGNPAEAPDVLRDAELAMYYAKRLGGDRIEAYRASARSIANYNRASEEDLERGMRQGELSVQYQPVMNIASGQIVGAEALMRWNHPTRGVVNPDEFVPLAERSGQIEKLGRLAFEQAATQAREWSATIGLGEEFFISVNLSPTQLATETLLNDMRNLVAQDKTLATHLKLEITEGQVMSNPEHSAYMLEALRSLGLGLALDDFGTGHSSLSYLHRFPFDTIKIPAAFVKMGTETGNPHTQAPIIRAIVGLAEDLDLMVIAEGVETLDEIERLRQMNCRFAQGFAFGAAMTGQELAKKLMAQAGR
ncbi:sensor domain-containing phosphodiesterase [Devosia sp. BK]|uniref:EAL domain-containing protein n=1 Tax=unclassified Devosia TaxID=196773 RepID=UPI000714EF59|nr:MULTISPECIES: EAL domain-containing protein [unclassified Devosia]KQN74401.1 diguanylate cyclase [Devosia sp. Leaf64]MDV3251723.1 sensor domain-containing phosphodiesterase [Devosia sp. BK]